MTSAPATRPAEDPEAELLAILIRLFDAEPSWVVEDAMNALQEPTIEVLPPKVAIRKRSRRLPAEQKPWPAWRVRVVFLLSFVVVSIPIFTLMVWFWRHSSPAHGLAAELVDGFSYVWIVLAIPVLLNVIGALAFRNVNKKPEGPMPAGTEVCFRIVTRGTNVEAVLKSALAVRAAMAHTPLFPFSVEIVTDNALPEVDGVRTILVPKHYRTDTRARFKARALHYALEVSPFPTPPGSSTSTKRRTSRRRSFEASTVPWSRRSVRANCGSAKASSCTTGTSTSTPSSPWPTRSAPETISGGFACSTSSARAPSACTGRSSSCAMTSKRRWGSTSVTPDRSPRMPGGHSVEMAHGRRSRWIDGYCLEQSTQSVMDFLKQRRRWFVGLCLVCLQAPARMWHRVTLVSSIVLWGVGWLGWWSVSIAAVVVNARIPLGVLLIGTASLAAYSALYLLGLELNLDQRGLPGTGACRGTSCRSCSCPSIRCSKARRSSTA